MFSKIIVLVLFGLCLSQASEVRIALPNVPVELVGETIQESSLNRPINRFLGVPYAQPPVGKLRFRRPQPWIPSTETFTATSWPNNCVQNGWPSMENYLNVTNSVFSEDCLYLNVWSPPAQENGKLRPVLVWFHGGALYFGGTSFELYNGETLASRADAVVVSVNYRLSTLGFLYSNHHPEIRGNQGLWDQALALQWVQQNIESFGGDPAVVTIFGESAGSWSVSTHILSPVSQGLFTNAILLSGVVMELLEPEVYEQKLLTGIRQFGCAKESDDKIDEQVVECLEQLDAKLVYQILFVSMGDFTKIIVVRDGEFIPAQPREIISSGRAKQNFNVLVSTVEDEGGFVFVMAQNDTRFRRENPTAISLKESQDYLKAQLERALGAGNVREGALNRIYYSGLSPNLDNSDAFRRRISEAYGDYLLTCPSMEFSKSLYGASQDSVRVYQWFYRAKLGDPVKWICTPWMAACHTDDLFPLFGVPFRFPDLFHSRERDISNEVISFVAEFIRTGKPGPDHAEWEPYFSGPLGEVIAPYYELGNGHRTSASIKFNLKQLECETVFGHPRPGRVAPASQNSQEQKVEL